MTIRDLTWKKSCSHQSLWWSLEIILRWWEFAQRCGSKKKYAQICLGCVGAEGADCGLCVIRKWKRGKKSEGNLERTERNYQILRRKFPSGGLVICCQDEVVEARLLPALTDLMLRRDPLIPWSDFVCGPSISPVYLEPNDLCLTKL